MCATANSTPQVDGAMASCLRDLPPCTQTLIDEMGQHWRDLEQLKAAGGTPTARIMKGLRVGLADDGSMVFVVKTKIRTTSAALCATRKIVAGCVTCAL